MHNQSVWGDTEAWNRMDVEFRTRDLERIATEAAHRSGFPEAAVVAYRKRLQVIRAARDERDLYQLKSFRFEKLLGNRSHQRSIRLNDQWRLILEIRPGTPGNTVVIVGIEDYH